MRVNFLIKKRRLIPSKLLLEYKARLITVRKNQVLFDEGDLATDYMQVEEGQVKMFIVSKDGQEFTQGIFNAGESFGEPALLGNFNYPSGAVAMTKGKIWKLARPDFLLLLKNNFDLHLHLDQILCERLQYKSMILTEISTHDPEHRIYAVLSYYKNKLPKPIGSDKIIIPFTRQQLADMTGMRVETVIRTVKKMEKKGKLALEEHKIKF